VQDVFNKTVLRPIGFIDGFTDHVCNPAQSFMASTSIYVFGFYRFGACVLPASGTTIEPVRIFFPCVAVVLSLSHTGIMVDV
jgi:hypothetical protein